LKLIETLKMSGMQAQPVESQFDESDVVPASKAVTELQVGGPRVEHLRRRRLQPLRDQRAGGVPGASDDRGRRALSFELVQ
jgi:hypothetical protein